MALSLIILCILNNIYTFFAIYNSKYKTKIRLKNILQSDKEIIIIIDKICNFNLEFLFDEFISEDIENIEDKDNQDPENPNENESDLENESENLIISDNEDKIIKDYINFNENIIQILLKKGKRTYQEDFGPDNEVKKFFKHLNTFLFLYKILFINRKIL